MLGHACRDEITYSALIWLQIHSTTFSPPMSSPVSLLDQLCVCSVTTGKESPVDPNENEGEKKNIERL